MKIETEEIVRPILYRNNDGYSSATIKHTRYKTSVGIDISLSFDIGDAGEIDSYKNKIIKLNKKLQDIIKKEMK